MLSNDTTTAVPNIQFVAYCPLGDEDFLVRTAAGDDFTFWSQGLIHKCLYVGEEIILEEVSAQTLKLLCEGSRSNVIPIVLNEVAHV